MRDAEPLRAEILRVSAVGTSSGNRQMAAYLWRVWRYRYVGKCIPALTLWSEQDVRSKPRALNPTFDSQLSLARESLLIVFGLSVPTQSRHF
jgi:hypothetical protein